MRKFYRSTDNQLLAGICGGLSEIFKIDANLVRIGLVFLALITYIYPAIITYLVAWMILPEGNVDEEN